MFLTLIKIIQEYRIWVERNLVVGLSNPVVFRFFTQSKHLPHVEKSKIECPHNT